MKVRATQDGHYGGYYRSGPITTEQGTIDGVVFEISDEIFPILDIDGKKVLETNEEGKPVIDQKTGKPKFKMGSWFAPEWMEKMPSDTPITYDLPKFEIPIQYRLRKPSSATGPISTRPNMVGAGVI